jgi:hypothetical protein
MIRPNAEQSVVWSLFEQLYNILTSPEAEVWFKITFGTPSGLRLYHNLVMDCTILFTKLVAFASDPKYQQAVLTNTAIDPKALDPVYIYFDHFKYRLSECIVHSNLGPYDNNSVTIALFPTLADSLAAIGYPAPAAAAPSKRSAADNAFSRTDSYSSKKPKAATNGQANASTTNPSPSQSAKAKAAGMLKLVTPGGPLPKPHAILHNRKGVCMNFVTQGFYCRFTGPGKECFNGHPSKLDDIPAPIRDHFCQWVAANNALEWVAGKGPAGTV